MAKLHELLAVESDLRSQAESCRADLKNTFEKKGHHFSKKLVTFKPATEGAEDKVESQLALQTTVSKELGWISEKLTKALDAGHQIDVANTKATANVELEDGTVLLMAVPATSLLRMEHRIQEIRELIHTIPTLDPAKGFEPDSTEGDGIFKARDVSKARTTKIQEHVVVVQPTKEHPAQVVLVNKDVVIGQIFEQEWSSLITVAAKGDMLDRVEQLIRAVKQARARANELELDVRQNKIGADVLKYIIGA